jgi:hypothetical protein
MDRGEMTHNQAAGIRDCIASLMEYCQENNWAGFDPYDALNSRLLSQTPFMKSRVFRIAITQALKRLPINLRPYLLISQEQNPKAIGLFLMALLKLKRVGLLEQDDLIKLMVERLVALRSPGNPSWCWGYSFPWQTRTIMVPRGAPNIVCTSFVANALLDAYEEFHEPEYLRIAVSAGDYILSTLYWTSSDGIASFSYPLPGLRSQVHNANFLAAALFCRIYKHCSESRFFEPALRSARYSASRQHEDGSWDYGEDSSQAWVDNFHTGYNLCALRTIGDYAEITEFESHLSRGFDFYCSHFFREDGAPKYFHDRTYPIDIHSVAQSVITLASLKDLRNDSLQLAHTVWKWALSHMWDKKGYFYYQVLLFGRNRIPYMRWSQAWMLLASATLLGADAGSAMRSKI